MKKLFITVLMALGAMCSFANLGDVASNSRMQSQGTREMMIEQKVRTLNFSPSIRDGFYWMQNSLRGSNSQSVFTRMKKGGDLDVSMDRSKCPRFAVLSDIHVGSEKADINVPRAFRNLIAKDPSLDAIFVCGDLTGYGFEWQYDELEKILNDKSIIPEGLPVYLMMGNHDNYKDPDGTFYKRFGQPLHQYVTIKGYPFITISTRGTANSGTTNHDDEAYNFLIEKLADAAKKFPGKPIFVFNHYPASNTVYGSEWGNPRLYEIMQKYPQVIAFSGHSHYPLSDPRSIYQKDFTSINDGSSTYTDIGADEVTEGAYPAGYDEVTEAVIVNVDEDSNVEVERWNTTDNVRIQPSWNIVAPHDGKHFLYNNCTGGEKPYFTEDAKIVISDITTDECKITFDQAKDDQNVHHYLIEILQGETVVATNKMFSGFFLQDRMPATLTLVLRGIPSNAALKARITALDSYDNASEPIYSRPFSTKEYKPAPGSSCPKADLLDVEFGKDGAANDISVRKTKIGIGQAQPSTYFDELYNMYGATFNGGSTTYYKVDYKNDQDMKKALQNGFTFEMLYKPRTAAFMCPMSTMEYGGVGFEQENDGYLYFYTSFGGYEYVKSTSLIEPGKYYHVIATYDKKTSKMCLYINGNPVDSKEVSGEVKLPGSVSQYIAIGGDARDENSGQNCMDGELLMSKIYSKAVSRDEVYWMYKAVNEKKSSGYKPTPGSVKPKADLFDVQFKADGTVKDLSERNITIDSGATLPIVRESESFFMNEAIFSGSSSCYYRINYAEDEAIKNALKNGFTCELLYSPDLAEDYCPLSATESGGFGFEQDDKGTIQLYVHLGGSYQVLKSNVQVIPGHYYHVIAIYNKEKGMLQMYVNGLFAGSEKVEGDFDFPEDPVCQWIAIGGDSSYGDYVQYAYQGKIALARMYGKAVNRDEVYWLYKEVQDKQRSDEYVPAPEIQRPVADLFDIKVNSDGTAEDVSSNKMSVVVGSNRPTVGLNKDYNKNEASFSGDDYCYYGIDYQNNQKVKDAFINGFAFEVVYSTNNTANVCPMSSQQSGGCGIEQGSDGLIQFYLNLSTGRILLKSNVKAIPGRYYHVVATYDKKLHMVDLYIDGKLRATANTTGDFVFSESQTAQWIGIGGDSSPAGIDDYAQYPLNGNIMLARMYGKYLTRDEVYLLHSCLAGEKIEVTAGNVLSKMGVGYPTTNCSGRKLLVEAVKVHKKSRCTVKDNNTLRNAIETYMTLSDDIQMPVSGKAYTFCNVGKYGTKMYLAADNTGSVWQKEKDKATVYICKEISGNKYMFVNNAGKYFTWFGNDGGYNENKGFADTYVKDWCDISIVKMVNGNEVSAFNDSDLFGLVALKGKANGKIANPYLVGDMEGNAGVSALPVMDDNMSSAILVEEADYKNTAILTQVSGIDNVKFISTFSAPFATVVPKSAKAYKAISSPSDSSEVMMVVLEENTAIPANQGVVITSDTMDELVMEPASVEKPADLSQNLLKAVAGRDKTLTDEDKAYVLTTKDNLTAFYKAVDDGVLQMNEAYLSIDKDKNIVKLNFTDVPTAIGHTLLDIDTNTDMYDLSGRKVTEVHKNGVYIRKGKKVYVK